MPEIALANMVNVGITGAGMEQGIEMAFQALSNPTIAGPGSHFFRDEASLIVIFVSDEKDWSAPWVTYLQFLMASRMLGCLFLMLLLETLQPVVSQVCFSQEY